MKETTTLKNVKYSETNMPDYVALTGDSKLKKGTIITFDCKLNKYMGTNIDGKIIYYEVGWIKGNPDKFEKIEDFDPDEFPFHNHYEKNFPEELVDYDPDECPFDQSHDY